MWEACVRADASVNAVFTGMDETFSVPCTSAYMPDSATACVPFCGIGLHCYNTIALHSLSHAAACHLPLRAPIQVAFRYGAQQHEQHLVHLLA
jgi:hypothetical protein